MLSQRRRRRVLYGLTVWSWLGVGHCSARALKYETVDGRVWLMLMLFVAAVFTVTALFAYFIAPIASIYRQGVKDGRDTAPGQPVRMLPTTHTTTHLPATGTNGQGADIIPMRRDTHSRN